MGRVLDEVVAVHEEGEVFGVLALLGNDHGVGEQRRGPEVIKEKPQGRHGSCPERGVNMNERIGLMNLEGHWVRSQSVAAITHEHESP
jgi:hypothetical protein